MSGHHKGKEGVKSRGEKTISVLNKKGKGEGQRPEYEKSQRPEFEKGRKRKMKLKAEIRNRRRRMKKGAW